jgi:murein L,D-transpeptidase YcbB/YkuD
MNTAQQHFGLGTHARYETDLAAASIRFFDEHDVEQVRADIQVAGTWSPKSETWMWGWENESIPDAATAKLAAVRDAGLQQGVKALVAMVQDCDEDQAWRLAALAVDIVHAQCVYRTGNAGNRAFLLLFNLRRVG